MHKLNNKSPDLPLRSYNSFKVAKLLMALHSAGLQHNNIESSIVVKNGEPRLIDLGTATLHTCERTMDIEIGKPRPDALEFACTELHDFASEQGIWEPSEWIHKFGAILMILILPADIFYYGAVIPKQFITSAESLLAMTPAYLIRTAKGRKRILCEAAEILRGLGLPNKN